MSLSDALKQGNLQKEDRLESAVSNIAEKLAYAEELAKLLQITRADNTEKKKFAVLYALNTGSHLIKSKVLNNYMVSYFALANSKKGESRKELIDVVRSATPQLPKGFWERVKGSFG